MIQFLFGATKSGLPFPLALGLTLLILLSLAFVKPQPQPMNPAQEQTQLKLYTLPARSGAQRSLTLANVSPKEHELMGTALRLARSEADAMTRLDDDALREVFHLNNLYARKTGQPLHELEAPPEEVRQEYQAKAHILDRLLDSWERMGRQCATHLEKIAPQDWEIFREALTLAMKTGQAYRSFNHNDTPALIRAMQQQFAAWGVDSFALWDEYWEQMPRLLEEGPEVYTAILEATEWEAIG